MEALKAAFSVILFFGHLNVNAESREDFGGCNSEEGSKLEAAAGPAQRRAIEWTSNVRVRVTDLRRDSSGVDNRIPLPPPGQGYREDGSEAGVGDSPPCVLRFRFPGTKLDKDSWAEQRFEVNPEHFGEEKGLRDVWVQYDLFIPENFSIRDPHPRSKARYGGAGDKEFVLFADKYSGSNPTFVLERLYRRSDLRDVDRKDTAYTRVNFYYNGPDGKRRSYEPLKGGKKSTILVDPDLDKGHWQRRTLHVKMPSSRSSKDGIVELWVMRRAETPSPIVQKLVDEQSGGFFGGDQNYLNRGYILGWNNTGYDQETVFLVDNFILTDSPADLDPKAMSERVHVTEERRAHN